MKTKIFISLFILYFLGACNSNSITLPDLSNIKPYEPVHNYTNVIFRIKGTITDSITKSPVAGADITLFKGMLGIITGALTNNEGHYSIEYTYAWDTYYFPVSADELDLRIMAKGYGTKHFGIRITDEWQIIDVQFEPESGGLR